MTKYDFIVIGSGCGLMFTEGALGYGKKCAIVENFKFGGTCLTKGCIPSKVLVYPADLIREAEEGERIGIRFQKPQIDWNEISKRVWGQIDLHEKVEARINKLKDLNVYKGTAQFTGPHTIKIKNNEGEFYTEIEAENFVIAAGAHSFVPPIKGLQEAGYITSELFFGSKYPKRPYESLAIIGAGPIGAEFAHIFASFGTKVSLIEMNPRILSTEEEEVSEVVRKQFVKDNINVYTSTKTLQVTIENNMKVLHLENMTENSKFKVECEEILIASGVRSNAPSLKLENAGVETDKRGYILTNEYLETNVSHIWAIGDINGKYQFRHKANKEAEILLYNMFKDPNNKKAMNYDAVPWAIFTHPQVAHVGKTEREVKEQGCKYKVGINRYSDVTAGRVMGFTSKSDVNGFVKLIVGEDKSILGAHVVGPNAAILLQPYVYMMNCNKKCEKKIKKKKVEIEQLRAMCPHLGTYTPMDESMIIHPAMSELTAWVTENLE
ncbi:MAG: Mycothione reductase [Firmicutes bacterium ADurb.Bin146]|nr:MAG: Mycothione reductase [Firmicutes bacterium ADurb.Bin146]